MSCRIIALLFATFLATFVERRLYAANVHDYQAWTAHFRSKDPLAEAQKNFAKGEVYVIAAMGAGHFYPGLPGDIGLLIEKKHSVRNLPGISDAIGSTAQSVYTDLALSYARAYNRKTAELLGIAVPDERAPKSP